MSFQAADLPASFAHKMQRQLGNAFPDFVNSLSQPAPVSIRLNPWKKNRYTQLASIPWASQGRYLAERPVFTLDPFFHAGSYYVQEASSMFLEQALRQCVDLHKPLHVLDLCAAPGGKSTHMISLLNNESLLVTNEVIRSRAAILAENIQKWGCHNVAVTNNDPEDFQRLPGFFDVIVVDAPCSGEGLFRKDPEAMREWSDDNVVLCSRRQRRILSDIWPSLKENGILVYSTCTYNPEENEENLAWLKQEHDVEFLKLRLDPLWGNIVEAEQGGIVGYHFYPHLVQGEGFFISVIRKNESSDMMRIKNSKAGFQSPIKKIQEQVQSWIVDPDALAFIQRDDLVQFLPADKVAEIELLSKNLRLIMAGTFVATVKNNKIIPEHALALSTQLNREAFPSLALNPDDALHYLRRETLQIPTSHTGFTLMCHEDIPLGWGNVLPNRINNLYPAEWRIRMSL
ncbi:MAG TPA: rRNA methyltransferase [Ohtaekwangia sp.]|uniref:methyltransferase RsmF C-terminal domain-like protein n=1 Tax=Ohtaekwangia sp. TaxID=2066019 RepID=UPI002F952D27